MRISIENKVLSLIFDDLIEMRTKIEPIATKYEGAIDNRIGYNFPKKYLNFSIVTNKEFEYVIAYVNGDRNTAIHEMSHAKFYLDSDYRKHATKIWNNLKYLKKQKIEKRFRDLGYHHESTFVDEYAAYLAENHKIIRVF